MRPGFINSFQPSRDPPSGLPPSVGNLLVWMDANDLVAADGASVSTMPNKGSLGGTWSNSGGSQPLAPLAATVGGRRALSFQTAWPAGTPNYGYNTSSFTFPAVTAAQGVTLVVLADQKQSYDIYNVPTFYLADVGSTNGGSFGLSMYVTLTSDTPFYTAQWHTTQPSQTGSAYDANYKPAPQRPGEFVAYGTQLSTTLTNNQSFFQLRQNNTDYSTFSGAAATGTVGTLAGQVKIGGTQNAAANYNYLGWIREVLVWNTLVSTADIRAWLDAKYGPTW